MDQDGHVYYAALCRNNKPPKSAYFPEGDNKLLINGEEVTVCVQDRSDTMVFFKFQKMWWWIKDYNLNSQFDLEAVFNPATRRLRIIANHKLPSIKQKFERIQRRRKWCHDIKTNHFVCADGGKRSSVRGIDEKNDCTVRATAVVLNTSYDVAHHLLEKEGRKPGGGIRWALMMLSSKTLLGDKVLYKVFNRHFSRVDPLRCKCTLGTFVKRFSEGRYFVNTRGHVQAVVDGKIYDLHFRPFDRVITAYKLEDGEA